MKKIISLNLQEELINKIDEKRNGINRSLFIEKILMENIKEDIE